VARFAGKLAAKGHALPPGLPQLLNQLGSRQAIRLPPALGTISASLRQPRQPVATGKRDQTPPRTGER